MESLQRTHNRGSISTGYDIENSLKVERTNTEYLHRNVSTAGNAKVWCASMWIKRTELDGSQQFWQFLSSMTSNGSGGYSGWPTRIGFWYSTDGLWVDSRHGTGNARLTSLVFQRDTSAWYHIVVMQDTTQSTDTNRTKIYINGTLLLPADLDYDQYPAQNADTAMHVLNSRVAVGAQADGGYPWSGYIADVHLLDGQTGKTPSDFAEYDEDSGIWKPKAYTGAYGTNGFHLKFEDSSNMGLDSSGNGNNLTSNNIAAADQATDTPTNNFSTLNPLIEQGLIPARYTVSEGGTKQISTADGYGCSVGTIGVSKGKWYFEAQFNSDGSGKHFGVIDEASFTTGTAFVDGISPGQQAYGVSIFKNGGINIDGSYVPSYSFSSFTTETLGCAMDLDNNKLYFSRSGTYGNSGDPTSGATGTGAIPLSTAGGGTWFISTGCYTGHAQTNQGGYTSYTISSAASDANGYGTFEYAPPSGYYALCTKNLEEFG